MTIQIQCRVSERDKEVIGFLAIDSTIAGCSGGGVRIKEDITPEEVRLLARNMTLKYGYLGIPQGGAKGGIIYNPEAPFEERRQVISLFTKGIAPFLKDRIYTPGPDIGTDNDDIQWMLKVAGRKKAKVAFPPGRSGYYTALSVCVSAERASEYLGMGINGARVAVEGFGKVGLAVSKIFAEHGAKIIAVSTSKGAIYNEHGLNIAYLIREFERKGSAFVLDINEATKITKEELLTLDLDILAPCGTHHTINKGNVHRVKARIISAGANVPLDQDAEKILSTRSILYLPDFVTNCGGVLGVYLEMAGLPFNKVCQLIPKLIGPKIDEVILHSSAQKIPPSTYATRLAIERFRRLKESVEGRGLSRIILRPSAVRFVRNLLPSLITGKLGVSYFRKSLAVKS